MIPLPDYPSRLSDHQRKQNFREVFDSIKAALETVFGPETALYTRKKYGFFAWKRHDVQAKCLRLCFFWLTEYNYATYRLRNDFGHLDVTNKFWPPIAEVRKQWGHYSADGQRLSGIYRFELSFVARDLDQIASSDLVRFVESVFDGGRDGAYPVAALRSRPILSLVRLD